MDTIVLKTLADDNRLAIVRMLAERERCVCELATALELSDALVSHHIKRLRLAGLVKTRRSGQWLFCSLVATPLARLGKEISGLGESARTAPASDGAGCASIKCAANDERTPR